MRSIHALLGSAALLTMSVIARPSPPVPHCPRRRTKHWTADNGNGTYSNPLFYEEFEDPDLIRVGNDYYLASTTMHMMPAVFVMHSKDLVNWELAGYCADKLDLGPTLPPGEREHLRQGYLGAVHSLSQRHVLCLRQRQRRAAAGLSAPRTQGPVGALDPARPARPVGAL